MKGKGGGHSWLLAAFVLTSVLWRCQVVSAANNYLSSDEDEGCNAHDDRVSSGSAISNSAEVAQANPGALVNALPGLRPGSFRYHLGDGFFYHRQRMASGRVFLRCVLYRSNPSCPVRAVMNPDRTGFRVTLGEHNHAPDDRHEMVQGLRNSLLEACRARPNARVDIIYHDVCRNVPRNVSNRISLLSIRPSMIRVQGENRPNIPHSFDELDQLLRNHEELRMTLDSQTELYQGMTGAEGHRSLLFMSRRVLAGAGDIRHVFGNGTFYARPNQPVSSQLYTLVTVRDNHILPLGYALMESRTEQAYRDLFQFLRRTVPEFDPDFFMTDFEVAQQTAILRAFPRVRLSGCLWHYARAVCRNVRSLGLHQRVRDDVNARRLVRLSLAIPLAPPDRVLEALNAVVIESRRLMLHDTFANFFQYIRRTWVEGVGERILSVFGVRHRSNNVAECHHRNINARLVRRPNVWRFIEILRELEDISWRDLGRLEVGQAPSRARRVSSLLNDARVRSCSRQVLNREMDMLHFLASTSWHLNTTMTDMLRVIDEEERPVSPVRGPPRSISDVIRLAPENQRSSVRDQVGFDVDFQEYANGAANRSYSHSSLDASHHFDELMDDNYENTGGRASGIASSRGRGGRGRSRAVRGRGRSAGRDRRRTSASPSPMPSSSPSPRPMPEREIPVAQNSSLIPPVPICRSQNFSDAEELPEGERESSQDWRECMICNTRVGRYTMLPCGAFPVCGTCINRWFTQLRHNTCPHCNTPSMGWVRLDI